MRASCIMITDSGKDLAAKDFPSSPFTLSRELYLSPHLPLDMVLGTLEVTWFRPGPVGYLNERRYAGLWAGITEASEHAVKTWPQSTGEKVSALTEAKPERFEARYLTLRRPPGSGTGVSLPQKVDNS